MPVYIRKNVSFTPPSIHNMQLEDDTDYLLDPDQLRDVLPQPYRMIDKILLQLLDTVWGIVDTKEKEELAEARKIRPPVFQASKKLDKFENACAMTSSKDGKYIFFGLPDGIIMMDALNQADLSSWEDENAQITNIKSHLIGPDIHLLVTIDDMATVRLFLCAFDRIFFVKALNENVPEANAKVICHKCEASLKGDYIGALFENTGTKEMWMEVHKLPVEGWLNELQAFYAAVNKQEELKESESKPLVEQGDAPAVSAMKNDQETHPVTGVDSNTFEKFGMKFSQLVQVMKVKRPPEYPLPGNASSSVASALSKVDTGDVLGTGLNHILSTAHLESMDAIFRHKNEANLKYLPTEKEETVVQANFHFLGASNMISYGLDQTPPDNRPVSLAVWWTGTPHLCQYSLLKTGKDLEFKPDIVWPFSSMITCSATSDCTTHLAVGLDNGNVILWNRQLSLCKAVLSASERSGVKSLRFLDPCLFPADTPHYPPYPKSAATFLLAECADGTQVLFDTCDGSQQIPRLVAERPEDEDNFQTLLQAFPSLPELMIYAQKDGNMYIKDIGTGTAICQVGLPATHNIQNPWDPIFALGAGGQILYVKGEGTEIDEEGEATDISGVFMYHARSYPLFDQYWTREYTGKELSVYTTAKARVAPLMLERFQQQSLRKTRLQQRWSELRSELDVIQTARQIPVNSMRITTPSSINSSVEEIRFRKSRASVI